MRRALVVALTLLAFSAGAHERLEQQIATATARIAAEPSKAILYLDRGELYRLHEQWDRARADYARAEQLDPELKRVAFARGRMELEAGNAAAAKSALDVFLAGEPQHAEARLTRARASMRLGQLEAAVADYDAAITHADPPSPDLYFERAKVLTAAARADEALRGLDEGIARLGLIASLQRQAIEIELSRARYDAALTRLDTLTARAPRKESYLAEKGTILARAGRHEEARAAYADARERIAALPEAQRRSAAMKELAARVDSALQRHQ